MDERERFPVQPPEGGDLGGMTEATGSLTPEQADDAFVPAETREVNDPRAARDITAAAHRRREARRGASPDDPGQLRARDEDIAPNDRDGGYGSEHGLAGDDPAYREEEHLPEPPVRSPGPGRGTRLGQDEPRPPSEEHF